MKKRRIRSRLWLDECGAGAAFFVGTTCRKEAASRGIYPLIALPAGLTSLDKYFGKRGGDIHMEEVESPRSRCQMHAKS